MRHYTRAIVKPPGRAYTHALASVDLGRPDLGRALQQHAAYVDALKTCGLEVTVLTPDDLPDSVFVEDVAICLKDAAIMTRPGAESRRGESRIVRETLEQHYDVIHQIESPATVDGGDVLETADMVYIGDSERTTYDGFLQCQSIFKIYDELSVAVRFPEFLHLKSGVSYLGDNTLLVAPSFRSLPEFETFKKIVTLPEESYAANAVAINGQVLVAAGYPGTRYKLQAAGFNCIELEMSEFQKKDGGLSCLSLRF